MANPFATLSKGARQGFSRNYGGTSASAVADPYISGYHFIKFVDSEWSQLITDSFTANSKAGREWEGDVSTFLASSCLAVTPPGGTLNKAEFIGLGGTKWSVPTNIDYGNTITIKFLEFSWLPVLTIFHTWIKAIRDYRSGVAQYSALGEDDYTKSRYAASMYYWTTKPNGQSVEYAAMYSGMFPTKDPQDLFTGDLTAVDKLEIDIEFNVDWIWHEDWVFEACEGFANERHGQGGDEAGNSDAQTIEEQDEEGGQ